MISIAMATYNGASYLRVQLDSLAGQTRRPDELVICDDGSTDDTIAIAERFAETAPFAVRIHRNPSNLGVLRNFEKALGLTRGEIIFLSDQDDVWLPDKIATVMQAFEDRPERMVVLNDKYIVGDDLQPGEATMLGNIRGFGSPDTNFVAGCTAAFRRSWLDIALPIPPGPPAHDSWLVGLAHRLKAVGIVDRPLQLYRRHGGNVSQNVYSATTRVRPVERVRAELAAIGGHRSDEDFWGMFIAWHQAELDRIGKALPELGAMGLGTEAARALDDLDRTMAFERARRRISRMRRWCRAPDIVRLWLQGGYVPFSGWKSALKDFLQ